MWYLYILKCMNGSLYTGITDNFERRLKEHLSGKGGHYTRNSRPTDVIYKEEFIDRVQAQKREQQIKRWSKVKKLALISGNLESLRKLSVSGD